MLRINNNKFYFKIRLKKSYKLTKNSNIFSIDCFNERLNTIKLYKRLKWKKSYKIDRFNSQMLCLISK